MDVRPIARAKYGENAALAAMSCQTPEIQIWRVLIRGVDESHKSYVQCK